MMGGDGQGHAALPATEGLLAALDASVLDPVLVHAAVCTYVADAAAAGWPITAAILGIKAALRCAARRRHADFEPFAERVVTWCIQEYYRPH